MKYRTFGPPSYVKSDTRTVSDAVLYLYFPPGFTNDRFFYVDDILPIIDSLRIDSN